jgi:hypothetical protein
VTQEVLQNVAAALGEFGLVAEGEAKKELQKGHGVITGTLRRSIHTAQPGYGWTGDDVTPSTSSPERGGKSFKAVINGVKVTIQLGSGLKYALAVHQGHHSFQGYHFLTIGVDKAKKDLPKVLARHKLK